MSDLLYQFSMSLPKIGQYVQAGKGDVGKEYRQNVNKDGQLELDPCARA